MIGGGIADLLVKRRRGLEVGEEQGDAADRNLVARPQHILREEVAEGLQRGDPVGGQAIGHPLPAFDDGDARAVAVVLEAQTAGRCHWPGRDRLPADDQ